MRGWIVVALFAVVGCKDKAEPDYAACVQAEAKNDVIAAEGACNRAVYADPNSASGKAAAAKLKDLAPAADKVRAEQAKAADESRQAAAQARAARLPALRAKANIEEDGEDCASSGKPPRAFKITGGTYDDNFEVAQSLGCVREHPEYLSASQAMANYFCCP